MTLNNNPLMLTTQQAAERLSAAFGETQYWMTRLANERKREPVKGSNPLPAVKTAGRWGYAQVALDDWIGAESARRLARGQMPVTRAGSVLAAFGVGQVGGSSTGRKLQCVITAQVDEATGEQFVQLMTTNPMIVYRLTGREATSIGGELQQVGTYVEKNIAGPKGDQ